MSSKESDPFLKNSALSYLSLFYGNLSVFSAPGAGTINETLFVEGENGVRLVLQRDNLNRPPESFLAEHEFVGYLRSNGFPAVNTIVLGSSPFFIHDRSCYAVYPFIPGDRLNINNIAQMEDVFEAIGQFLHLSYEYADPEETWKRRWWNVYTYPFEDNFETYLEGLYSPQAIRDIYYSCKNSLFSTLIWPARNGEFKSGIVHSDFRPEHFLFNDGKLEGIVDWTSAHHDAFIMELARPFLYICQSSVQRAQLLARIGSHLELSQQEREAAFYSPLLVELVEFVWIVRNQSNFSLEEFDKELSMVTDRVIEANKISGEV